MSQPGGSSFWWVGDTGTQSRGQGQAPPPTSQLLPDKNVCPLSPQEAFVPSLSLYTQGEGGVQTGGDGEDLCQVSDSVLAQDLRGAGVGGAAVFFAEPGCGGGSELAPRAASDPPAAATSPPGCADAAPCRGGAGRVCVRQKYGLTDAVIVMVVPVRGRAASCLKCCKSQLLVLTEIEPGG